MSLGSKCTRIIYEVFITCLLCTVSGRPRDLAVACWTTDHYHPCSNLGAAYLKVVSSLTSLHYILGPLDPFSLPCAQKWP